jgi:3',5'-cyclic AMP phosphodiesterase CpdA
MDKTPVSWLRRLSRLRRAQMKKLWFNFLLILLIGQLTGCRSLRGPQPFVFVQMCDTQLGFGGYEQDLQRFKQAVKQINELQPDFVVICGDLVNHAEEESFLDFILVKNKLAVPCYCAPGNHDVGNLPTAASLERYRKRIGKDYYAFEHKGAAFVVANTQLWKAPLAGESEKHDLWFKQALRDAAAKRQPVFVITHYPLFVKQPDEPDGYFNLPLEKRKELLADFERYGVVAMLSGHTHRTVLNEVAGIQLVASQTTSKNFDNQPFGFRLWHVGATRPYQQEFVPLNKPRND